MSLLRKEKSGRRIGVLWSMVQVKSRGDVVVDPALAKPGPRGEKWALFGGEEVTVLQKLGKHYVEIITKSGLLRSVHVDLFVKKIN